MSGMTKVATIALLSVILTAVLASDETQTTLLTRGREFMQNSIRIWWVPPLLSILFILSMHVWVYGIVHVIWYIISLFTSRIYAKRT